MGSIVLLLDILSTSTYSDLLLRTFLFDNWDGLANLILVVMAQFLIWRQFAFVSVSLYVGAHACVVIS
jgi:hypothetical protein